MKTTTSRLYEAMFLVDSAEAASDWEGVHKTITNILKRAEAEVVLLKKWDERRLAYEIDGQSRGTYILCYFRADGQKIRSIERAVQLSENIMRVLVLCTEGRNKEDIERDTAAMPAEESRHESTRVVVERTGEEISVGKPAETDVVQPSQGEAEDTKLSEDEGPVEDGKPAEDEQATEDKGPVEDKDTVGQEEPAKEQP